MWFRTRKPKVTLDDLSPGDLATLKTQVRRELKQEVEQPSRVDKLREQFHTALLNSPTLKPADILSAMSGFDSGVYLMSRTREEAHRKAQEQRNEAARRALARVNTMLYPPCCYQCRAGLSRAIGKDVSIMGKGIDEIVDFQVLAEERNLKSAAELGVYLKDLEDVNRELFKLGRQNRVKP